MSWHGRDIVTIFDTMTIGPSRSSTDAFPRNAAPARCSAPSSRIGYSMPIGGVVAYRRFISPSGVGYDIACGNLAAKTDVHAADIGDWGRLAAEIQRRISFGIGRANSDPIGEHPVFDRIAGSPVREQRGLLELARQQLGTVGSGNRYVDLLEDEEGDVSDRRALRVSRVRPPHRDRVHADRTGRQV